MLLVSGLRVRAVTCAALAACVLASCGQQDGEGAAEEQPRPESSSSSSAGEEAPSGTPDCSEVWQQGGAIPRGYQGCADETGTYVERDALGCSSGQRMVRYGDRFWGVLGGTVNEAQGSLEDDRDYRISMRSCTA